MRFRWVDIARMLGMSTRTLSRRRQEFGMPLDQEHNYSSLSDGDLDNIVRSISFSYSAGRRGFGSGSA